MFVLNCLQVSLLSLSSAGSSLNVSAECADIILFFLVTGPLCLILIAGMPLGTLVLIIVNILLIAFAVFPSKALLTKFMEAIMASCSMFGHSSISIISCLWDLLPLIQLIPVTVLAALV